MLRILIRNIASNWIGFVVQATVVFFLTPFVVDSLGDARYGIWALVTSFTGYYGLLDLGFRSGITQYLTRHLAGGDFDSLNRTASTAVVVLTSFGIAIFCISVGLAWIAPSLFEIPVSAVGEVQWCIVIIGLATAFQFTTFTFSAVFAATQRYDVANAIGVTISLSKAVAVLVVLKLGYGLVGLCLAQSAGDLVGNLLRWWTAHKILPTLRIAIRSAARKHVWPIAQFGGWSFLIQNAISLRSYSGAIIVGLSMSMVAVARFNLAVALALYFDRFFAPVAIVFFPAATALDTQGDTNRLKTLYLKGSKMLMLLAIPLALIAGFWAYEFYGLWVGPRFVEPGEYAPVPLIFIVLLVSGVLATGQKIGVQIFLGTRKLRTLAALEILETLSFLILAVLLIRYWGLLGFAYASLLTVLPFRAILQPIAVSRILGFSLGSYLQSVYLRPCIVGVVFAPVLALIRATSHDHNWLSLAVTGVVAFSIAIPLLILLGLDAGERNRFISEPVRRVLAVARGRYIRENSDSDIAGEFPRRVSHDDNILSD